jgi:multimeric flavodoxin WrbA
MKVLAVMGSRRNGNTTEIVNFFEKELKGLDASLEFEYLYMADMDLPFCTGCHNCIFIGEDRCPHYRTVKVIEDRLLAADGVILATPGYMFSVQGYMKNFLDHVAYNCHRPKYFGKPIFFLSAATKWQMKSVFAPMETWGGGAGFRKAGKTFVEMYPFPASKKETQKKRAVLKEAAARYHKALLYKGPIKPKFGDVMVFHAFRTLSDLFPTILQADRRYFEEKGAYRPGAKWYVPAKISPMTNVMARIAAGRMRKGITGMADMERARTINGHFRNKL